MRTMTVVATAALLMPAVPASAGQSDQASQAAEKAMPEPDKKVCRRTAETGSHFQTRTCRTAAEWRAIDGRDGLDTAGPGNPFRRTPVGRN